MLIAGEAALAKSRIPLLRASSHGLEQAGAKPSPDALGGPGRQVRVPTMYSGNLINGKKVMRSLNSEDLEPGKKHLLYFQNVQRATGQSW